MIRTLIIAIMATLCSVCSYGQQSFFDKYAEMDGVTSVYITKSMLSLFPKGHLRYTGGGLCGSPKSIGPIFYGPQQGDEANGCPPGNHRTGGEDFYLQ